MNKCLWTIWDFDSCIPIDSSTTFQEIKSDYHKILNSFNIKSFHISPLLENENINEKLNVIYDFYKNIIPILRDSKTENEFISNFINYCLSINLLQIQ